MIWSKSYTHYSLAALAVIGVLGFALWQRQHDAYAKAQAVQAAQQQFQQQLADQQKQMEADFDAKLKARDAEYQIQIRSLGATFQRATTPKQQADLATGIMGLPSPIEVLPPTPTAQEPKPQTKLAVPLDDVPQAKAYFLECETCKLNLAKTQADLADVQAQRAAEVKLAQQQIDSLKAERNAALTAAKGGNWIHRLGRQLKVIACSGAGAAAGGTQGAKGAAIGAVGGAVACSLF